MLGRPKEATVWLDRLKSLHQDGLADELSQLMARGIST
jgi:hypothetical protein